MSINKQETSEPRVYYTLTVEQEIGQITEAAADDRDNPHPPLRLAFMMAADYFAENAREPGNRLAFKIHDGRTPDRTIAVTVED